MSKPHFDTAEQCLQDLERRVRFTSPVDSSEEAEWRMGRGEKQEQCSACGRWRWGYERCNHFAASQDGCAK